MDEMGATPPTIVENTLRSGIPQLMSDDLEHQKTTINNLRKAIFESIEEESLENYGISEYSTDQELAEIGMRDISYEEYFPDENDEELTEEAKNGLICLNITLQLFSLV